MKSEHASTLKCIEDLLHAKQITPTPVRVLVLEFILLQKHAITLGDLERGLYHADKATLYRTLKTFEEKGMIHTIESGSDATNYALCKTKCAPGNHLDHHMHFHCTGCRKFTCLPEGEFPVVELPEKYKLDQFSFIVRGICDDCAKNANELHIKDI